MRHLSLCPSISTEDLQQLWDSVCKHMRSQLLAQKGVTVPKLGIFTFEQVRLDVGPSKFLLIQRPVFQLMEKFCQNHALKYTKYTTSSSIPTPVLNYTALMQVVNHDRDSIERGIQEIISSLNHSIAEKRSVKFYFPYIGRLLVHNDKAKFRFYKDFVQSLEHGNQLLDVMQNRPGTADSIASSRSSKSVYSVILPLGKKRADKKPAVECIPEIESCTEDGEPFDDQHESTGVDDKTNEVNDPPEESKVILPLSVVGDITFSKSTKATEDRNISDSSDTEENKPCWGIGYKEGMPLDDKEFPSSSSLPVKSSQSRKQKLTSPSEPVGEENEHPDVNDRQFSATSSQSNQYYYSSPDVVFTGPLNHRLLARRPKTLSHSRESENMGSRKSNRTCGNGHPVSVGQELCYLCHQRANLNAPVSFNQELYNREVEEDRLRRIQQELQANDQLQKEREKLLERKINTQKVAAYNLGASEAVKEKNKFKDPRYYPSYLMFQRSATPPRHIQQQRLKEALTIQVDMRKNAEDKLKTEEEAWGKLEQAQLSESLKKERQFARENRLEKQHEYLADLNIQVQNRPPQLPACVPNVQGEPIFGRNDPNEQTLLERRRIAQGIQSEQLETVRNQKENALLAKLVDQTSDEEMLKWSKADLLHERAARYNRHMRIHKDLESDWLDAMRAKKQRDEEERLRRSVPVNVLVQEQCDKYHRCGQCCRHLHNKGESNVWRESYYIPGSRHMA